MWVTSNAKTQLTDSVVTREINQNEFDRVHSGLILGTRSHYEMYCGPVFKNSIILGVVVGVSLRSHCRRGGTNLNQFGPKYSV